MLARSVVEVRAHLALAAWAASSAASTSAASERAISQSAPPWTGEVLVKVLPLAAGVKAPPM